MAELRVRAGGRRDGGARRVNEYGCLCWNNLVTADPAPAELFYTDLFGWEIWRFAPEYAAIRNRGNQNGGVITAADSSSFWLACFAAERLEPALETAGAAGGMTVMPPTQAAAARFAILRDPQGAVFALIEGELDP